MNGKIIERVLSLLVEFPHDAPQLAVVRSVVRVLLPAVGDEGHHLLRARHAVDRRSERHVDTDSVAILHFPHNFWKTLEIHTISLKFLEIHIISLKILEIYKSFLKILEMYKSFLKLMEMYTSSMIFVLNTHLYEMFLDIHKAFHIIGIIL